MYQSHDEEVINKKIFHRKWDNAENRAYLKQIKTVCVIDNSRIPLAWAREAYEFLRELQRKFPNLQVLNIKEQKFELKFFYSTPDEKLGEDDEKWLQKQLAKTRLILILKNAYPITIEYFIRPDTRQQLEGTQILQEVYEALSPKEILNYQQREPEYTDSLLLDTPLPKSEVNGAYQYLDSALPKWRETLTKSSSNNSPKVQNVRLQIMFKLAEKFSFFKNNTINGSEEILSIDKFSTERTRALWGNDISLQLMLKLYERGDRESIARFQLGEFTDFIKNLENELLIEKEKEILVENIVAYYRLKTKDSPVTANGSNH